MDRVDTTGRRDVEGGFVGDLVRREDEVLPIPFESAQARATADVHFEPAPDSSLDDLLASPWRAHMAFRMAAGVVPMPDVEPRIIDALDQRSPLPWLQDDVLYVNFTVEDGTPWSQQLMADVGEFVVNLVNGSSQIAADIVYHPEAATTPRLRLIRGRRRG